MHVNKISTFTPKKILLMTTVAAGTLLGAASVKAQEPQKDTVTLSQQTNKNTFDIEEFIDEHRFEIFFTLGAATTLLGKALLKRYAEKKLRENDELPS